MRLVLASASPRRADLLAAAGFVFDVVATEVDESPKPGEDPRRYAARVAGEKAACAAARCPADAVILAADTVVVAGGRMMGKPANEPDAASMLRELSGRAHDVHTAVVVRANGQAAEEVVTTVVHVAPMTPDEIAWYVATGEPMGKAGAYAIQGRAARFIERIEGSWSNVVGLPIATAYRLLSAAGLELPTLPGDAVPETRK